MKPCATCNEVKPLSEFYKNPTGKDGYFIHCKFCHMKKSKKWAEDNVERYKNNELIRRYGITWQKFNDMIEDQSGQCAICATHFVTSKNTQVDHCHLNNNVRGLLCNHCNLVLGHAKDSVQILENAVEYLKLHSLKDQ